MKKDPPTWTEGEVDAHAQKALKAYKDKLVKWNRKFSLTSVPENQMFQQLISPSVWLGLQYAEKGIGKIADFGSGAGIPGVPMAIVDRTGSYILVDSSEKKAAFLRACASDPEININRNMTVLNVRLEPGEWKDKVDAVVSRGAGKLVLIADLWDGKVKQTGRMDIFKGPGWEEEVSILKGRYPGWQVARIGDPDRFDNLYVLNIQIDK